MPRQAEPSHCLPFFSLLADLLHYGGRIAKIYAVGEAHIVRAGWDQSIVHTVMTKVTL